MLVLGINTAGEACDVALVDDGADAPLAHASEPMTQGHDARLAPLVRDMCAGAGVDLARVDRIAVVVGPGSFTGVRVGVAFAHGLSLVLGVPAVGVTSLEALDPAPGAGRMLGVLPAKRRPPERSWWVQILGNGAGEAEPLEADIDQLHQLAASVGRVIGAGVTAGEAGVDLLSAEPTSIAAARFASRLGPESLRPASPVYVRAPDALPMAARHTLVRRPDNRPDGGDSGG